MPMGDLSEGTNFEFARSYYEWKNMMDYDRGFNKGYQEGYRTGLKDAANTQVPVSPSADQPRNLRPAEKSTATSTCERVATCARDQTPEEPLEEWGPRLLHQQTTPEDSELVPEIPQSDYPSYFLGQYQDPSPENLAPVLQASVDRQEEALDQLEFVLERFQAAAQVLDQLLEDAATLFDLQRSKEDLLKTEQQWSQGCLPQTAVTRPPNLASVPYVVQDSGPGFVSQGPQTGSGQWFPR